jgi:hypothetical protein
MDTTQQAFLNWAIAAFRFEISTSFARAQTFDSSLSRRVVSIIQNKPVEQLDVLASILPLGVLYDVRQRNQLPSFEKRLVEELLTERDSDYLISTRKEIESGHRLTADERLALFRKSKPHCNRVAKRFAKESGFNLQICGKDFGFLADRKWGKIVLAMALTKTPEVTYSISLLDHSHRPIRQYDSYLAALGISDSYWKVEDAEQAAEKFSKAWEFARWHVEEYEKIMDRSYSGQ